MYPTTVVLSHFPKWRTPPIPPHTHTHLQQGLYFTQEEEIRVGQAKPDKGQPKWADSFMQSSHNDIRTEEDRREVVL